MRGQCHLEAEQSYDRRRFIRSRVSYGVQKTVPEYKYFTQKERTERVNSFPNGHVKNAQNGNKSILPRNVDDQALISTLHKAIAVVHTNFI